MITYALSIVLPVSLMNESVYRVYLMNLSDLDLAEIKGYEADQERLSRRYAEGHNDVTKEGDAYVSVS